MTRDTFRARGGREAGHDSTSHRPAGAGRPAPRVKALRLILCCALALQPSLIAPGRGSARAASVPRRASASGSTAESAGRSLLALAAAVGGGVRRLLPAGRAVRRASAASEAAYEPEPAAAFLIGAPSGLTVQETHDSRIVLTWPAVAGAVGYRVERSPNLLTPYQVVGQSPSNGFEDTANLARGHAYLYRVRAVDAAGARSAPGPVAMATAIDFVDPVLAARVTTVKADHLNELRLAVAGVRGTALLSTSWEEEVAPRTVIKAEYVRELRRKLDEGLAALGLPLSAYEGTPLNGVPNGSVIRKIHFEQLRERSTRGAGVTGSGLSAYDFASARLDPNNRTGAGGVDLYSGNFNWSLPVLSLPGRAGLDLGLSLTYNSRVWTRSGDYMLFDGDWGWPAPGFRLGFPVVQGQFTDAQAGTAAYMLITPSGARGSLRRTGTPTVYESGDSSYLQLTEIQDGRLELLATDGTLMTFRLHGGYYKCTEVKDRNGNFITVAYDAYGNVDHVTDTLGRLIDFEYYSDGYLKQITQTWQREIEGGSPSTETHRWAKFEYDDAAVNVHFPGGTTVFGPTGGQTFRALRKVTLADDSAYTFGYTSWGQVNVIENLAAGGGLLSRVRLDLPADASTEQADCPRPAARRDWAAYWNGDDNGAPADAEEAVTSYALSDGATWVNPVDNQPQAGRLGQQTLPDGTVYKEFAHSSGWDEGLVRLAQFWSGGKRKKWTSTAWTQDDELLPYVQNPRVGETNVYDYNEDESPRGRRRTTVSYIFWGLPEDVREYDSDATTVLRRTHTVYKATSVDGDGAYALRRIIGLPEKREVFGREDGQEKLFSKVTYEYDNEPGCLTGAGAPTQHKAEYDANFKHRGNVCVARRWDVGNLSQSVASYTGYDTAGSVVFTRDADGHQTTIEYAAGAGALAYPTKVTNHDGFYSTIEYNYDTGAVTRAVDPKGAAVKTFYDAAGRRLKVKNEVEGGYTRWEYGASGLFVKQWTKVDTDKDETFVITVTDGAGRGVGALREHPGEGTGYAASRTEYDPVSRVLRQYRPSEVSVDVNNLSNARAWVPAGEDAAPQGWPHSTTEYDWRGRPKKVIDLDGKDSLFEYGGCGCAGGELVTVKGKQVAIPGTNGLGRRTQRVYHDVLGRASKTEVLGWEGNVYSTTTTRYDMLDRPVRVRQYAGAAPSDEPAGEGAGYRTTTMTYDGHG
ncbi:MAG TPA: fibronectin type III domain-containing protein, partial [Phycisphaerales bacterium]|nr:fibronectin type III domain-containing protein [Phycisphaerales bacterium]